MTESSTKELLIESYNSLVEDFWRNPNVLNKLVLIYSSQLTSTVLEDLSKDEVSLKYSKILMILCLQDWLLCRSDKSYKHFIYTGEDEFLKRLYKTNQYKWYMLDDSPTQIPEANISSLLHKTIHSPPDELLEEANNSEGMRSIFVILTQTALSECYLRVLSKEEEWRKQNGS